MKSAEQIQMEAALAAGAARADEPETGEGGMLVQMTRAQALQHVRNLEQSVDFLADRVLILRAQGKTKRADRAFAQAVTKQTAAQDLREALERGSVVRGLS